MERARARNKLGALLPFFLMHNPILTHTKRKS